MSGARTDAFRQIADGARLQAPGSDLPADLAEQVRGRDESIDPTVAYHAPGDKGLEGARPLPAQGSEALREELPEEGF